MLRSVFRRAAARALSVASTPCAPLRASSSRVTILRANQVSSIRSFTSIRARFADNVPAAQEQAATSETTDAISEAYATSAAASSQLGHKQEAAATSETTDQVDEATKQGAPAVEQDDQTETTIYVGNMPWTVEVADLENSFAEFGQLRMVRISRDPEGKSKGFGFIRFSKRQQAQAAIEAMDMADYAGRTLRVRVASDFKVPTPERKSYPPGKTVYIGNLSFNMSDRQLNDLFRDIKNVTDVRVAIDRRTGQPRGFAHADFTDIESAKKCIERLNGKYVSGRELRVDYAPNQQRNERPAAEAEL